MDISIDSVEAAACIPIGDLTRHDSLKSAFAQWLKLCGYGPEYEFTILDNSNSPMIEKIYCIANARFEVYYAYRCIGIALAGTREPVYIFRLDKDGYVRTDI